MKPQTAKSNKKLTISQASRRLEVHASTIRRYILSGRLKALQYSKFGTIRISEAEIERFEAESEYCEPLE